MQKMVQKEYKNRHEWVGKVIHLELCKRLNFDYATKLLNVSVAELI